jgi:hypothetical protein
VKDEFDLCANCDTISLAVTAMIAFQIAGTTRADDDYVLTVLRRMLSFKSPTVMARMSKIPELLRNAA